MLFITENKIDQVQLDQLLEFTAQLNALHAFDDTFMVSALNGDGCQDLMKYLAEKLPDGPFMYPEDQVSDLPLRILAAQK